jgi:transposase, IS5 family
MATDDFFRARLDSMIDMRHPLAMLATRMPCAEIESSLAPAFAHRDRAGKVLDVADLFGATAEIVGAGVSTRGRRRLPIRLMVALVYRRASSYLSPHLPRQDRLAGQAAAQVAQAPPSDRADDRSHQAVSP